MRADIEAGRCEWQDCTEPFTHVTRWDKLGADEPSFNCYRHTQTAFREGRPVQSVEDYNAELAKERG